MITGNECAMDQIRMNRLDSQFDKAVDCLREAIAIYEEIGKKNSYLYASAQNNLALVYLDTNDTEHAEACLQDAHAIVHDLAAQSPVFIPGLAASYCNLASVRYQNQEYDKALSYCEKALNEYERVPEKIEATWRLSGT